MATKCRGGGKDVRPSRSSVIYLSIFELPDGQNALALLQDAKDLERARMGSGKGEAAGPSLGHLAAANVD